MGKVYRDLKGNNSIAWLNAKQLIRIHAEMLFIQAHQRLSLKEGALGRSNSFPPDKAIAISLGKNNGPWIVWRAAIADAPKVGGVITADIIRRLEYSSDFGWKTNPFCQMHTRAAINPDAH